MAGSGWQQLGAAARELAGVTQTTAKALTSSLGKAVVSAGCWTAGLL